jgi:uncharacterized membrane protein SpoIIM required for sporulation
VDLDWYLATNRPSWDRLAALATTARQRPSQLSPAEVDELISLYQRTSAQRSFARRHFADPALTAELNRLVATANAAVYRRTASPAAGLRRFFTVTFPGAVWHIRGFVAVAAVATLVPVAIVGIWLSSNAEALAYAAPEAQRAAYVDDEFQSYYSSQPAGQFATEVLVNNIQVSFLAFAAGVVFGLGTVLLLVYNGANLGVALALFIDAGKQATFWGLVLPHGFLELTAVVIAGAAGMTLGWALVAPGEQSRAAAFTDAARRSVMVVLGLMLCFVVAGIIEAFVTPSGLPTAARIGLGLVVELTFVTYVVSFGRRAAARGLTGLARESLEGDTARAVLVV